VPQDTDTQYSWYDAREEGGFPAPALEAGCSGEACQGAPGVPPGLPSLGGSAVTAGGGNLPPPPPATKAKAKPLTRAQKLAKALAVCRRLKRAKRHACEVKAKRAYGPKAKKSAAGKSRAAARRTGRSAS